MVEVIGVLEAGWRPSYPYQKDQLQTSQHTFEEGVHSGPQGHYLGTRASPISLLSSFEHHGSDLEHHQIPQLPNQPHRPRTGCRPSCT